MKFFGGWSALDGFVMEICDRNMVPRGRDATTSHVTCVPDMLIAIGGGMVEVQASPFLFVQFYPPVVLGLFVKRCVCKNKKKKNYITPPFEGLLLAVGGRRWTDLQSTVMPT